MIKECFYTSHDFNARNDEKILQLRSEFGWEGYGLYWALIEMMGEANGNKLSFSRINGLAMALPYDKNGLAIFVEKLCENPIKLFESNNEFFWSKSLLLRIELRKTKSKRLSEAGKRGAVKRWKNNNLDSQAITTPMLPQCETIARKGKERKGKEKKGKKDIVEIVKEKTTELEFFVEIITYLNEKAGTNYRATTPKTKEIIKTRMSESFTVENFKTVIDKKTYEWLKTDYEKFLRPETLFSNKFEGYLNQPMKRQRIKMARGLGESLQQLADLESGVITEQQLLGS